MYRPGHGYAALRKGRVSVPHATYFVTLCVKNNVGCSLANDLADNRRAPARFLHGSSQDHASARFPGRARAGLHEHVEIIRQVLTEMEQDHAIQLRAGVVMPDHVHLLFILGERLTFSQVIGRFKAKTRHLIFQCGLIWQQNVFEHRMRPDESVLPVLHYMFMNPYRQEIIGIHERWPGFFCGADDWQWFQTHLHHDLPYPEWLDK